MLAALNVSQTELLLCNNFVFFFTPSDSFLHTAEIDVLSENILKSDLSIISHYNTTSNLKLMKFFFKFYILLF